MPKRYYRRTPRFPEGVEPPGSEIDLDLPLTEDKIKELLDIRFRDGNIKSRVGCLILRYGLWEQAMQIGLSAERHLAFRSTWALEWAYEHSRHLPEWFADRMIVDFISSDNGSLHRVYAKMLYDQLAFRGLRPSGKQAAELAEKCFDLIISPRTQVAVRCCCMELLVQLSPHVAWIAEELEATVRRVSEMRDCSPGTAAASRRILFQINK